MVVMATLAAANGSPDGRPSSNAVAPVPGSPAPPSGLSTDFATELEFCGTETNRYRATLGLPPLTRSSDLEAYAAAAARQDGNELPWWPRTSVRTVIQQGLATMWAGDPVEGTSRTGEPRGKPVLFGTPYRSALT